jgi:hypothetical protein
MPGLPFPSPAPCLPALLGRDPGGHPGLMELHLLHAGGIAFRAEPYQVNEGGQFRWAPESASPLPPEQQQPIGEIRGADWLTSTELEPSA